MCSLFAQSAWLHWFSLVNKFDEEKHTNKKRGRVSINSAHKACSESIGTIHRILHTQTHIHTPIYSAISNRTHWLYASFVHIVKIIGNTVAYIGSSCWISHNKSCTYVYSEWVHGALCTAQHNKGICATHATYSSPSYAISNRYSAVCMRSFVRQSRHIHNWLTKRIHSLLPHTHTHVVLIERSWYSRRNVYDIE